MKKHEYLGVLLVISAMVIGANAKAAYYDFQEVQGSKGTEIVISVNQKQSVKPVEQKKSTLEVSTARDTVKPSSKDDVIAKYNLTPADSKPQLKPKEEDVVASQSDSRKMEPQKQQEMPRIALNTTPVEKPAPKVEESYEKIEQPAQEKFESKVEENHKYYDNWSSDEAQRIVTKIGTKLQTANGIDIPLKFYLVEEEEVNACTDIDKNIYVFSGILPYVETEDELAFIIGHEMGHAASNHVMKGVVTDAVAQDVNAIGKKALQKNVTNAAASKISGVLGSAGFGNLGNLAGGMVVKAGDTAVDKATDATTSTLQRGREADADLLSVDYLVKNGYNPLAGISIMTKIGDVYPDLFVDHPSTDKRVVKMYNYIQKNYPQYLSKGFSTEAYGSALSMYVKKR